MKKNEYKCASCQNVYTKGWTDEEANKEGKELWGVENATESEEMEVICDDCFNRRTPQEIKSWGDEYKSRDLKHPLV